MTNVHGLVIAIDGPSGSGKSSSARGVASRLGLAYLDTGAMYRAVAWRCLQAGLLAGDDRLAMINVARQAKITIGTNPDNPTFAIDGCDVTEDIRSPQISAQVSTIATIQPIRDILTTQMRQMITDLGRIVVEGRDITTKVWPQADVRVLLVADPVARVTRRKAELAGAANHAEVTDQIVRRDRDDSTMSEFEKPAPGVTLIDSTDLSLDQVITRVVDLVPGCRQAAH